MNILRSIKRKSLQIRENMTIYSAAAGRAKRKIGEIF